MDFESLLAENFNSFQLPGFIQNVTTSSPEVVSKLSSISMEQVLWIMGGLMLFRIFGGLIFSVLSLTGVLVSTVSSVVCTFLSVLIKVVGVGATGALSLLGSAASAIVGIPMRFVSQIFESGLLFSKYVSPAIVSILMTVFFYNPGDLFGSVGKWTSEVFASSKDSNSKWEAIEKVPESGMERF